MKKIIISLSVMIAVGEIAVGATYALFSDTETSSGNIFVAGALDLKVDHTAQTYNGVDCKTCSVSVVSDTSNIVTAGSTGEGDPVAFPHPALLVTFIHSAWTADVDGAVNDARWVWSTNPVVALDLTNNVAYTFEKTFNWMGPISGATLNMGVAADNGYEVYLNGLLVGDDPASHTYVQLKRKACEEVGIHFELFLYPSTEPEQTLIDNIQKLNARSDIHGILVQLPLPSQNASKVIFTIDPLKDVDGFHPANLEKLQAHQSSLVSAVALGVMRLIREAVGVGPLPPHAVIVSSPLFAQPLEILLKESNVRTIVTQAEDQQLSDKTKQADILIVAEGIPGLIKKEFVKPGVILIDVGTTRTPKGLVGDVDFESVKSIARAITPVPGGVGPMTVAMLLVNILKAYELQRNHRKIS